MEEARIRSQGRSFALLVGCQSNSGQSSVRRHGGHAVELLAHWRCNLPKSRLGWARSAGGPNMSSLSSKQGPRYRHTEGESAAYETIGVDKLTPIIGAEISGVNLADPL